MTLLSIREQGAVKEALSYLRQVYEAEEPNHLCGPETFCDMICVSYANRHENIAAAERALILAIRDAIARQVREQASGRGKGASDVAVTRLLGWMDAATFIEGDQPVTRPLLEDPKAREIEATRNDYGACYAAMCKAQDAHRVAEARVAALEEGLKNLLSVCDDLDRKVGIPSDHGIYCIEARRVIALRKLLGGKPE